MALEKEWKKHVKKMDVADRDIPEPEEAPSVVQRCPKCRKLCIEFDKTEGAIVCKCCGFKQFLKK